MVFVIDVFLIDCQESFVCRVFRCRNVSQSPIVGQGFGVLAILHFYVMAGGYVAVRAHVGYHFSPCNMGGRYASGNEQPQIKNDAQNGNNFDPNPDVIIPIICEEFQQNHEAEEFRF